MLSFKNCRSSTAPPAIRRAGGAGELFSPLALSHRPHDGEGDLKPLAYKPRRIASNESPRPGSWSLPPIRLPSRMLMPLPYQRRRLTVPRRRRRRRTMVSQPGPRDCREFDIAHLEWILPHHRSSSPGSNYTLPRPLLPLWRHPTTNFRSRSQALVSPSDSTPTVTFTMDTPFP